MHSQNSGSIHQDLPDDQELPSFQVAFPDRLWHSALTHILSDDNIACVNELLNLIQDFPEIDITATKACSSKQKNLFVL